MINSKLKKKNLSQENLFNFSELFKLMKPRVMSLVIFTCAVGLLMAPNVVSTKDAMIAILLVSIGAGAAGALNMWYESDLDALMTRTCLRPIPMGKVNKKQALIFGTSLSFFSVIALDYFANTISAALLLFTILVQFFLNINYIKLDQITRLVIFFFSYFLYYFIIISFTVFLSLLLKKSTSALSLTIITWLLWTIFIPKTVGNFTESLTPLSTRIELSEKMQDDRSKGIDGHNPFDDRKIELEKEILARYEVDSLSHLPINFAGILMQADEEFGNQVWDKHYGELYEKLETQKRNYQLSGLINPFASLQSLSMASAGTDLLHHLDFLSHAEKYRRYFIKTLNDEYAFGGSKTGERGWKASQDFFRSIKDFSYNEANFISMKNKYLIDIFCLFLWSLSLVCLIIYYSKNHPFNEY